MDVQPWFNIMAKTIRAKFVVSGITPDDNGEGKHVTLMAVTSGSEENKSFAKYTPSGQIELYVDNPDAAFEEGEYYIDFTKVD